MIDGETGCLDVPSTVLGANQNNGVCGNCLVKSFPVPGTSHSPWDRQLRFPDGARADLEITDPRLKCHET